MARGSVLLSGSSIANFSSFSFNFVATYFSDFYLALFAPASNSLLYKFQWAIFLECWIRR
ncbi:hypothetical protein CW304_17170 [Bacillus sp. UFRGS-B20]|nr:hypothetical protein CW304_17170 [Bacillus sp. UFRGS-B20]